MKTDRRWLLSGAPSRRRQGGTANGLPGVLCKAAKGPPFNAEECRAALTEAFAARLRQKEVVTRGNSSSLIFELEETFL